MVFLSCKEKKVQEEEVTNTTEIQPKSSIEKVKTSPNFIEAFFKLPLKKLPIVEKTSFDSFIEAEDFKNINAEAFAIPTIYKNWNSKEFNFSVISGYRIELSKDFYTAVLTVKIGDHEMETKLVNYDLNGKIIDFKLVAYDEIADVFFKTESEIGKDKITIKNIEWTDEGHESTDVFKVNLDGKISILTMDELLIDNVISQLGLKKKNIKQNLICNKFLKKDNETIFVLPEIVEEGEEYFSLNTHIVIYNNDLKKITHKYFESHKTNNWVSDAVRLDKIEIDTAPYLINKETRAFGVRIHYFGSSRVNPYYSQTLSLFVKEKGKLKKVLHNYEVEYNGGEWNGACEGEFHSEKKTLIVSDDKTNGYFNFTVKNAISKTKNFETETGDCDSKEETKRKISILKFDGQQYK